jgi:hypothetical protein
VAVHRQPEQCASDQPGVFFGDAAVRGNVGGPLAQRLVLCGELTPQVAQESLRQSLFGLVVVTTRSAIVNGVLSGT